MGLHICLALLVALDAMGPFVGFAQERTSARRVNLPRVITAASPGFLRDGSVDQSSS